MTEETTAPETAPETAPDAPAKKSRQVPNYVYLDEASGNLVVLTGITTEVAALAVLKKQAASGKVINGRLLLDKGPVSIDMQPVPRLLVKRG